MTQVLRAVLGSLGSVLLVGTALAGEQKGVSSLSKDEQVKLAESAAPPRISQDATITIFGQDGKLVEVRKGTNGFTCLPTIEQGPKPDPVCVDQAALQFLQDFFQGKPKPTMSVPGIGYMARGGFHWEKDGNVVMGKEDGAKLIEEPPHWMIMWPFDAATSKLPTKPNPAGAWIMFEGSPWAHLMVYQDPMKMAPMSH